MIKEVKNVEDANKCDELLTKLILDERKYNDLIDDNIVIKNHFSKMLDDEDVILLAYYLDKLIVGYILIRKINDLKCISKDIYVCGTSIFRTLDKEEKEKFIHPLAIFHNYFTCSGKK